MFAWRPDADADEVVPSLLDDFVPTTQLLLLIFEKSFTKVIAISLYLDECLIARLTLRKKKNLTKQQHNKTTT